MGLSYTANESAFVGDADLVLSRRARETDLLPKDTGLTAKQRTGELAKSASPMLMLGSCSCRAIEGPHGVRTTERSHYKLHSFMSRLQRVH
jgi:hypothetical protein